MKFRDEMPDTGSKSFLKLKDKESVVGLFRGDIYEFYSHWDNGRSKVVPEGDPEGKFRFRVNFVVKDGSVYVPKIFENSATVYSMLADLNKEYELETTFVKITRNGTGMDTTYTVLPLLRQELSPEAKKYLDTLELLPLAHKSSESKSDEFWDQ